MKSFWSELQEVVEHDAMKALQINALKFGWELHEWAIDVDKCVLKNSTLTLVFHTQQEDQLFKKTMVLTRVVTATWQMDFSVMRDWRKKKPWAIVTNMSLDRKHVEDEEFHLRIEGFPLRAESSWSLNVVFEKNCLPHIEARTIKCRKGAS